MNKPTVAVVITHRVNSYDTWKRAFDGHQAARRAAGIVAHHINRGADDPDLLMVYLAATNAERLNAFLASADLKATMANASVVGQPSIVMVHPQEDTTVKRDPLAGAIVSHDVADYDTWKKVYDQHGATRAKAGVVGAAVNRVASSPQRVVIYLQADSDQALRAFIASPELKSTMQNAGVVGPPTIAFVTGAGWASYEAQA